MGDLIGKQFAGTLADGDTISGIFREMHGIIQTNTDRKTSVRRLVFFPVYVNKTPLGALVDQGHNSGCAEGVHEYVVRHAHHVSTTAHHPFPIGGKRYGNGSEAHGRKIIPAHFVQVFPPGLAREVPFHDVRGGSLVVTVGVDEAFLFLVVLRFIVEGYPQGMGHGVIAAFNTETPAVSGREHLHGRLFGIIHGDAEKAVIVRGHRPASGGCRRRPARPCRGFRVAYKVEMVILHLAVRGEGGQRRLIDLGKRIWGVQGMAGSQKIAQMIGGILRFIDYIFPIAVFYPSACLFVVNR